MLARSFRDLTVYQRGHALAMELFEHSKGFPGEGKYALTDQLRRSSRSVTANIAEAWGKRRYPASFVNKLSDSEAEALETQEWILFAVDCNYLTRERGVELVGQYEDLIKALVHMSNRPDSWCFPSKKRSE